MRICILDTNTNKCINVLEDDSGWIDNPPFIRAPRNDGEIGWTLLPNGEWDYKEHVPTLEEREAKVRARRDKFLVLVVDKINPVRWNSLSEQVKQDWLNYRQALLDVPQQTGFPDNVIWPEQPEL